MRSTRKQNFFPFIAAISEVGRRPLASVADFFEKCGLTWLLSTIFVVSYIIAHQVCSCYHGVLGSEFSNHSVNQVAGTNMCNKKLFPVCRRHFGITLYPFWIISDNRNPFRKHNRHIDSHSGTPLPVCYQHGRNRLKSIGSALNSHSSSIEHIGRSQTSHDQVGEVCPVVVTW